jgi:dihydrofolate synthase/folylpolyglutamate synthase
VAVPLASQMAARPPEEVAEIAGRAGLTAATAPSLLGRPRRHLAGEGHRHQEAGEPAEIGQEPFRVLGLSAVEWPGRLQRLRQGRLAGLLPPGSELWLDGGHNLRHLLGRPRRHLAGEGHRHQEAGEPAEIGQEPFLGDRAWERPPRVLICGSLYLAGAVLAANGTPPV